MIILSSYLFLPSKALLKSICCPSSLAQHSSACIAPLDGSTPSDSRRFFKPVLPSLSQDYSDLSLDQRGMHVPSAYTL